MKLINQVLRGVVIGIANIIPGVSGGHDDGIHGHL